MSTTPSLPSTLVCKSQRHFYKWWGHLSVDKKSICSMQWQIIWCTYILAWYFFFQLGINPRESWRKLHPPKKCSYGFWSHYPTTFPFFEHWNDLLLSCSEVGADPSHDDHSRYPGRIWISFPCPGTGLREIPSRWATHQAAHLSGVWSYAVNCRYFPAEPPSFSKTTFSKEGGKF